MKKYISKVFFSSFFICSLVTGESISPSLMKEQMCTDFDMIHTLFAQQYAPRKWKREHRGWDLTAEIMGAKTRVLNSDHISVKEFQTILKDFFNTVNDYHVKVHFYSTERATLPFSVHGTNETLFITNIDRTKLPYESFPFDLGDELVSFDGVPAFERVIALKQSLFGNKMSETDMRLAETFLTTRSAEQGHTIPHGSVTIEIQSKNSSSIITRQLIWEHTPEKIQYDTQLFEKRGSAETVKQKLELLIPGMMCVPLVDNDNKVAIDLWALASKKSVIPQLGHIVWSNEEKGAFHAYICETKEKKKIGYIRIPSYLPEEQFLKNGRTDELCSLIKRFEEETELLVIDEINNPGGSVSYLYTIISMLTDKPLSTPRHRMSITQSDVFRAVEVLDTLETISSDSEAKKVIGSMISGYTVTYQLVQLYIDYCRFIIEQWNAGKNITDPYHIQCIDAINPHPDICYTKKILVVVNELDFSGGDFFPAILQDNKRATIFGTSTAGAGGYVLGFSYPNLFGVSGFSYTGSIAERLNETPIEDVGVMPDISYRLAEEDFRNGYKVYGRAILEAVESLLGDSDHGKRCDDDEVS